MLYKIGLEDINASKMEEEALYVGDSYWLAQKNTSNFLEYKILREVLYANDKKKISTEVILRKRQIKVSRNRKRHLVLSRHKTAMDKI